jgi:hypothetical protein
MEWVEEHLQNYQRLQMLQCHNKPIHRIGETPHGMKAEMDDYKDSDGM